MGMKDTLLTVLKETVLPELQALKSEIGQVKVRLTTVEQRLDDFSSRFQAIDQHLIDQSRRIDEIRGELTVRIDQQMLRIDGLTTQVTMLTQEVTKSRQESAVLTDILRRLAILEDKVAA
jgi:hypothetical protein